MAVDAALLGALIGAGGAVGAQVVSNVFLGRRETRRAEADEARFNLEREAARASRFEDTKREIYARFAERTYRPIMTSQAAIFSPLRVFSGRSVSSSS